MQPDPRYATLDDPLRLSLAQMLVSMSREIDEIGAHICCQGDIAALCFKELQAIDLVAQKQREIARLISAFDLQETIDTITIEDMKRRLMER